jgi:4-hydroxybenzoate polyprenyltransferase
MIVDLMHLVVLVVGVAFGAWSLIAFRERLPRGHFVIFISASIGALFGCAAVGGEVGLTSQSAWFGVIIAFLAALAVGGYATARLNPRWR